MYKYVPSPENRHPGKLGLERMQKLLNALGNPQDKYPTVHVGGTSGKTSTSYFIARILQEAGYRTGLHISPHLQVATERMQVDGKFASEKEFVELINKAAPPAKKLQSSYFEILLAASFLYFKQQKVDIAVIEVGLGGRYDGTNVIMPVLSVITNVGLDHTHILGDTVEEITLDKREIIKPNIPVITGSGQKSVLHLIKEKAKRVKAALIAVNTQRDGTSYQAKNALLAKRTALHLNELGFKKINETSVRRGLKESLIAGRLEKASNRPTIILDGAHNPEKMKTTASALAPPSRRRGKWHVVFAATHDKDVAGMLKYLFPITEKLYITQYEFITDMGYTLGQKPNEIAKQVSDKAEYEIVKNAGAALKKAKEEAGKNGRVLVTGSLYLVGEIRNIYYPKEEMLKRRKYR